MQRVRALEAFLANVYGAAEVVRDKVVPRSLLTTSAGFGRQAHGIEPPNSVRVHLAGIDIVRDQAGILRVLEDNLQVPSGMSYVVENRRTMARVFPGLFLEQQVRPVASSSGVAARRVARVGAGRRGGARRGAAHSRRGQCGLFRARLPGPQDGHRAGRGPGPVLPRQHPVHAQRRRPAAGGCRLPARQRRLSRSSAFPGRLRRGVPRDPERRPGRQRHHRQRGRQRRSKVPGEPFVEAASGRWLRSGRRAVEAGGDGPVR